MHNQDPLATVRKLRALELSIPEALGDAILAAHRRPIQAGKGIVTVAMLAEATGYSEIWITTLLRRARERAAARASQ